MNLNAISSLNIQPTTTSSNRIGGKSDPGDRFANMLMEQIKETDKLQKDASDLSEKAALGNAGVSLQDAQIASSSADLHLRLMLQVRNKVVEVYKEVMNMPV